MASCPADLRPFLRHLAVLILPAGLASCGLAGDDFGKFWTVASANFGGETPSVSREMVDRVPYASIGVRFGGSPQAFVVLARKEGARDTYISADRAVLVLTGGRLVQTAGYAFNLDLIQTVDDPSFKASGAKATVRFLYDLRDVGQFGMSVVCTRSEPVAQPVETLGVTLPARRFTEACRAPAIDWEFENMFWVSEETGEVILSLQHFHPRQPAIEIHVLRPAAPG